MNVKLDSQYSQEEIPWVRKFTATPNALFLQLETIDFLQEGWR